MWPGLSRLRFFLALLCGVLGCAGCEPAATERPLRVAVAANFATTLSNLKDSFETKTGVRVELSAGSTGTLYAQIENGAPFDVFFAADERRPRLLERHAKIEAGSRFTYALGRLALYGKGLEHPREGLSDLTAARWERLALANPRLAPYGAAAKQALERLGLWRGLKGKLVLGQDVGQVAHFVDSGAAELGFVALSQVEDRPGRYWVVSRSLYEPIRQDAVVLADADPRAASFVEYVRSPEGRRILRRAGYEVP